jgi:hypothetical protein
MSESNEYPEDLESNEEDIENYEYEQQEYEDYLQRQEEEQFRRYVESFDEQEDEDEQQEQEQEPEQEEPEDDMHDFYDRLVERLIIDIFSPRNLTSRFQNNSVHNPVFSYEENITTYRYPYMETETSYRHIDRNDEITYNSDGFILNNFLQSFSDPIERVLVESLNQQPDLEKIYEKIEIESHLYSSIKETNKDVDDKCCICLAEFNSEDSVSILKCKHVFHYDCITEWSTYKINCPVCRENFKE